MHNTYTHSSHIHTVSTGTHVFMYEEKEICLVMYAHMALTVYVCQSQCVSVCLSVSSSVYLSLFYFTMPSSLSFSLSIPLCLPLAVHMFVSWFVYLTGLPVCPSVFCMRMHRLTYDMLCMCVCVSVAVPVVSVCNSIWI